MQQNAIQNTAKILLTAAALGAIVCFFMPWVQWGAVTVNAMDMATGNFFNITETHFAIANPMPGMEVANALFWLVPALCILVLLFVWLRKTYPGWYAAVAGAMLLGLATVMACFTQEVKLFNPNVNLAEALQPAWHGSVLCAIILVVWSWKNKMLLKILFLLLPVVGAYTAFEQIKKSQMNQATDKTAGLASDFTLSAQALIQEFVANDSAANKKYTNKILAIDGQIAELNISDSTASVSFADSTGSYAIFDFEKEQVPAVKKLAVGDKLRIKALCSGGIFSELLSTETISFKHAIIQP